MTIQNAIRSHLDATGQSMQSLSLKAGLNPKAISNILDRPGIRPNRGTIDALNRAMGTELPEPGPVTYAALIATLSTKSGDAVIDRRNGRLVSRLKTVIRAADWVPETENVDRRRILRRFAGWSPASLGLTPESFATYKADVLAAIDVGCHARAPRLRHLAR